MKEEVHPKTSKASIVTICNYFLKIRLLSGEWIQIAVREHKYTSSLQSTVYSPLFKIWIDALMRQPISPSLSTSTANKNGK
jgi:hypothetical protein